MAFVKEKIPQDFLDSFDPARLFAPYTLSKWRTDTWTVDHERRAAWIPVITDARAAAEEDRPVQTWYTMLLDGQVIGVLAEDGGEVLPGFDPKFNRAYELSTLENVNFYIPSSMKGRESEIVDLAKEAFYVEIDGPELPWVKGAEVNGVVFHTEGWRR